MVRGERQETQTRNDSRLSTDHYDRSFSFLSQVNRVVLNSHSNDKGFERENMRSIESRFFAGTDESALPISRTAEHHTSALKLHLASYEPSDLNVLVRRDAFLSSRFA